MAWGGLHPFAISADAPKTAAGHLHVPLTIQEGIYGDAKGVARHQEPVTVGIPLADSENIKNISHLGLQGASAGQFRVLGRWPSGNIEWLQIDTLADTSPGELNNSVSLVEGSGNFGGTDLGSDSQSQITVSTGTAVFTVQKKNFDIIDQAIANDHQLLKSGGGSGFVILGPSLGKTLCPCSTLYTSRNDSQSTAVLEENGPVRAVIRASGELKDDAGHAYMRFTARLHFYSGKSRVKIVVALQNADYGPSNSFQSAYKGFQAFEARIPVNVGQGRSVRFGVPSAMKEGSLRPDTSAYLYQAYSDKMEHPHWSSPDTRSRFAPRSYIKRELQAQSGSHRSWNYSQEGFVVVNGGSTLAKGKRSDDAPGWADISDESGAGVEIGVYQMAAYWPKSLQFVNGGAEARIGIWPDQTLFGSGEQQYIQSWPQYSISTFYLDFHSSKPDDLDAEFKKLQYELLARVSRSDYDKSQALLYPLIDPAQEDRYLKSLGLACCVSDISSPYAYRTYNWPMAGAGNQAEMRWSDLMLWLQRGFVARYVDAAHFYRFQAEQVFPRSDYNENAPFNWRDRPGSELDPAGFPENIISLNSDIGCDPRVIKCGRNWIDNAHAHWYGMIDYYFLTGDEFIRDAIENGASDVYGNPDVKSVQNGTYWNPRNIGEALMSDARLALFYRATGDSHAERRALDAGGTILQKQVFPELEVSGYGSSSQGVSRTRGVHYGCCPAKGPRVVMPFQMGILSEGVWEFLQAEGSTWTEYQHTMDLAYGIAKWTLTEAWRSNNTGRSGCISGIGPAYEIWIDRTAAQLNPSCSQTLWFNFHNLAEYTGDSQQWTQQFSDYLKHLNGNGNIYAEYGSIFQTAVIAEILNPLASKLVPLDLEVEQLKPGSYKLSWVVPDHALNYRIKFADRNLVDWLNFDPVSGRFGIDPSGNTPWFAASDVADVPKPMAPGSTQTLEVNNLDPKIPWHFAAKAYIKTSD
jgi:hypothetical protein